MINELFDKFDFGNIWNGNGLIISLVGYVVVFAALFFLYFFISSFTKALAYKQRKKLIKDKHRAADIEDLSVSGEINAAIAAALYLYFEEAHDIENAVLTIKKIQRSYSPWSSKIYGLQEQPRVYRINKNIGLK